MDDPTTFQALSSNVRRVAVELAGTAAELSEGRRGKAKTSRGIFHKPSIFEYRNLV